MNDNNTLNRIHNAANPYQGAYKRVLCVCSAGLLRSPTAALVLAMEPFNHNTRAAGLEETYALIPVDRVLLKWADEVVCMNSGQAMELNRRFGDAVPARVIVLDIPDQFEYRDAELMRMIADRYRERSRV